MYFSIGVPNIFTRLTQRMRCFTSNWYLYDKKPTHFDVEFLESPTNVKKLLPKYVKFQHKLYSTSITSFQPADA